MAKAKLTFLGAAGTVTGSRHFLELGGKKILIDCGIFQGGKALRLKNWEPLPVAASSLDRVLLTHAHIDHTGFLPRLTRDGFSGPIHCTQATADLCRYLLPDSGHLQEEEAKYANRKGYSKHSPALPLFTVGDAETCLRQLEPLQYGDHLEIAPGYRAKWRNTGHILGAAFIDIKTTDERRPRKIVFGGDLGRPRDEVLREPAQAYNVDYLVLESTYGDRLHPPTSPREDFLRVIRSALERDGVILIPAFSVGRTQTLLYLLRELMEEKSIPELPVIVDSPMAEGATSVFDHRIPDLNIECRREFIAGKRLFQPPTLRFAHTVDDSKQINSLRREAIILSASGMCTGGRILHHLKERLPHAENTVLFIGYQAEGTRGRQLLDGQKKLRMFGQDIGVRAHIESIQGFSGHADHQEILAWLMGFNKAPEKIFLVHGEPEAQISLAEKIRSRFGWEVVIPREGDSFDLEM